MRADWSTAACEPSVQVSPLVLLIHVLQHAGVPQVDAFGVAGIDRQGALTERRRRSAQRFLGFGR